MKRITLTFLVAFLAAWFVPVSDKAASVLSWICLIVAGAISIFLIFDWIRTGREVARLIELQRAFDPFARTQPDYLKRHRINTKPATRFKP